MPVKTPALPQYLAPLAPLECTSLHTPAKQALQVCTDKKNVMRFTPVDVVLAVKLIANNGDLTCSL